MKNILFFLGALLCMVSLSTIFWGRWEGTDLIVPVLCVLIGGSVFFEYMLGKKIQLGLIRVPVDGGCLRELILFVGIYFMCLPFLMVFDFD